MMQEPLSVLVNSFLAPVWPRAGEDDAHLPARLHRRVAHGAAAVRRGAGRAARGGPGAQAHLWQHLILGGGLRS